MVHDVPIAKIVSRYNKSIANCARLSRVVDRAYIYDNSVDNQDARILFRFIDGKVAKRYIEDIPQWSQALLY